MTILNARAARSIVIAIRALFQKELECWCWKVWIMRWVEESIRISKLQVTVSRQMPTRRCPVPALVAR